MNNSLDFAPNFYQAKKPVKLRRSHVSNLTNKKIAHGIGTAHGIKVQKIFQRIKKRPTDKDRHLTKLYVKSF
jgi:hypothetical protein